MADRAAVARPAGRLALPIGTRFRPAGKHPDAAYTRRRRPGAGHRRHPADRRRPAGHHAGRIHSDGHAAAARSDPIPAAAAVAVGLAVLSRTPARKSVEA
ncbi:hypothetical protein [Fodinicola feengrottensis]|uniref:hypothetical protein n=1 Tax=Fodinicola feengrottensis TaxID=435914 RepID=UPI0013D3494D|nr:hypothetical protein [Fodinicola feengrottensis]